jgi:hypothetical protein
MEGIETVDAILSKVFPGSELDQKMKRREKQASITIRKLKMDRLECLHEPMLPLSLMIDYSKKL